MVASTSLAAFKIGNDQQLRKPYCLASGRYVFHNGSVSISTVITRSFLYMAVPQEPASGPMCAPLIVRAYSSGRLGPDKCNIVSLSSLGIITEQIILVKIFSNPPRK